jgi:hypothetical protein
MRKSSVAATDFHPERDHGAIGLNRVMQMKLDSPRDDITKRGWERRLPVAMV